MTSSLDSWAFQQGVGAETWWRMLHAPEGAYERRAVFEPTPLVRLVPDLEVSPTIVIYDGYPGGVGIAELGFAAGGRHLEATRAVIERCPCARGCPSCVQSPKCGSGNDPLDKEGAVRVLRLVLGALAG